VRGPLFPTVSKENPDSFEKMQFKNPSAVLFGYILSSGLIPPLLPF